MRIVYLAAGAADMYCGSCLHDNTLAAALISAGQDLLLVPTYTPLRTDEPSVSQRRVLLGGINVYLQQKSAFFRRTPWFVDRLFDSTWLLGLVGRFAGSTQASELGDLTVSVLRGEHGNQVKEVHKLVDWLAREARPDLVHLSNSMLAGLAGPIRERLGVPIVCSLSGEDIFLEKLRAPHYAEARTLLKRQAGDIDAFVSLNRYFGEFMTEYLDVSPERIHVIPHGLRLAGHGTRVADPAREEIVIGYFARVCEDKGLHLLADAFRLLSSDDSLPPLKLRVAGYLGASDRPYLDNIQAQIHDWGLADRFEYVGELDREEKIAFLQSLDVMSVPTVYAESKGISVLEAMANAVPVVLPAHGTFPELIEDTGGGLLCRPHDPQSLADTLRTMIVDRTQADEFGRRGQAAIHVRYTDAQMAERTLELYQRLVEGAPEPRPVRA